MADGHFSGWGPSSRFDHLLDSLFLKRPSYLCASLAFYGGFALRSAITVSGHTNHTRLSPILKLLFAIIGAGAGEGTIKQWCRDHRAHPRYADTDHDPYNVQRGFFYAHIGWIIFKKSPKSTGNYYDWPCGY
ncbi:hypothetical protein ASPWEDRAFT_70336 [Aspergillus wentii DTO 134E9]|uniref:Fatty acid desaturase domain-containing protein n=1 Tax=Aspergillus wentii DTO 134E9 TaxID=1073089 RepID=A0A1L9RCR3_ASPWE|nr:uncharacterized protein ASPWEDRAFT_70336 [Aspergillus wentii DTO 134E9]OJJ32653.1 hypothetical protein ASPWEDRAFT_70336 [Aspergillus wentii DTO 134E9]